MTEAKTKEMIKILANVKAAKKALIVLSEKDDVIMKSASNIPGVTTTLVTTMNVYEILNHTSFIVTKEAINKIEEVYS
jgi:large subunit ribosomal protein L4